MPYEPSFDANVRLGQRRRLRSKTAANADHGYPKRPLRTLQAHRISMHKVREANLKQRAEFREMRKHAIQLLSMQPPVGAFDVSEQGEICHFQHPHLSHKIVALNGQSSVIYCRHCGSWSARDRLRHLGLPCLKLKDGNRHKLRLLQCGIMPKPEARIPSHLKLRYGRAGRRRKNRW